MERIIDLFWDLIKGVLEEEEKKKRGTWASTKIIMEKKK